MVWRLEKRQENGDVEDIPDNESGTWRLEKAETSIPRALGSAALEVPFRALETGARPFGSGSDEMTQLQDISRRLKGLPPRSSVREKVGELTDHRFIPRTPAERTLTSIVGEGTDFAVLGGMMGATGKSLLGDAKAGALFGAGKQIAKESGASENAQLGIGLLASLSPAILKTGPGLLKKGIQIGKDLLSASKKMGKDFLSAGKAPVEKIPKFVSEVKTPKAMADLKLSKGDLDKRLEKLSTESLGKIEKQIEKVSDKSFKDIPVSDVVNIEKEILKANEESILNNISPVNETQKKSWEIIGNEVESNFNAAKEVYTDLYEGVKSVAKDIPVVNRNTYKATKDILDNLKNSIFKAPEEKGIVNILNELYDTLHPEQKTLKKVFEPGEYQKLFKDKGAAGAWKYVQEASEIILKDIKPITFEKTIATKRSLNRILKKSDVVPAPVDLLKPVVRALNEDMYIALEGHPQLRNMQMAADKLFAETQRVFNNKTILNLRKTSNPEELTSFFSKPSNLERLNASLPGDKNIKDLVDRLVVENIASMPKQTAKNASKELSPYLNKNNVKEMNKIISLGNNLTSAGQKALTQSKILNELQHAVDFGKKPEFTQKLMRSKKGYDIVKSTLGNTKNGKQIFKSLKRGVLEDVLSKAMTEEGKIDFKKFKDVINNKETREVLKEIIGEEGLEFLEKLETYSKNFNENLLNLERTKPGFLENTIDKFVGKKARYAMYGYGTAIGFAPFTAGKSLIPILALHGLKQWKNLKSHRVLEDKNLMKFLKETGKSGISQMKTALEDKNLRTLLKAMGKKHLTHQNMKTLMKRFGQIFSSGEKD